MRIKQFSIVLILTFCVRAQTALTLPSVGLVRGANGSPRVLYGIAGNFVPGQAISGPVLSSAFSGVAGLMKSDSQITVLDAYGRVVYSADAPPGPALFAFTRDGKPALAWLPQTGALMRWNGAVFSTIDIDARFLGGAVVAIATSATDTARFIVQRDGELADAWVSLDHGAVRHGSALPGVVAPVLLLEDGALVFASGSNVVLRRSNGAEWKAELDAPLASIEQIGAGWVQITTTSAATHAVRTVADREAVYLLPEMRP